MKFRSSEQAVKYAFNVSERTEYARTDPMNVRGTSQESLSPLDLHAQAAMILNMVNRLMPPERDAVFAMYGRGKVRSDAIRSLSDYMMPGLRGVVPSIGALQLVILHWSTKRPSIRRIADEQGVSYRQVCNWRRGVLRAWMPLQVRALERLHERMFIPGGFELDQ